MEIYRWTAVWLTVHTGMAVIAPPMERVQNVSRTVGFGLKLWREIHKASNKKKIQYGIREIKKSSPYSLEHCQPLSVFIHFNYVSKSPSGVDTHNAQCDEARQYKNEMKYISPHDSLKTSLSLEINNKKSTSLSEQKFPTSFPEALGTRLKNFINLIRLRKKKQENKIQGLNVNLIRIYNLGGYCYWPKGH